MNARTPIRYGTLQLSAVIAAVGFAVFAVVVAVARRDRVALPGALSTFAIYSVLGCFIIRGHQWARWVLFAFALLTALTCLVFVFMPPRELRGSLLLAASAIFFALIGAALAAPVRQPAS